MAASGYWNEHVKPLKDKFHECAKQAIECRENCDQDKELEAKIASAREACNLAVTAMLDFADAHKDHGVEIDLEMALMLSELEKVNTTFKQRSKGCI